MKGMHYIKHLRATLLPKHFQLIHVLIPLLLFMTCLEYVALTVCKPEHHGLYGTYYDNIAWQGKPYTTSLDTEISTTTLKVRKTKSLKDLFSVKWIGYIEIQETREYTFFKL